VYLAEAIKEKDLIIESINDLCKRINNISVANDGADIKLNKELLKNKIKELENLYKECQKYMIIIDRAKTISKIKLNEEEFSIADAENILKVMGDKLDFFCKLGDTNEHARLYSQGFVCVDVEDLYLKIRNLKTDIHSIKNSVERSMWIIEV